MTKEPTSISWRAKGLLFENCNCQLICPGHVHFQQLCTHDRCVGYWAIEIREGAYGEVSLHGLRAVIAYDSPRRMIDGGWTQTILIDQESSPQQRASLETILTGRAGGPWAVLGRFVAQWNETRFVPIRIDDQGSVKRVVVEGIVDGAVEAIRGRDRSKRVTFENMFNQIHAPSQVIARGDTTYDDGSLRFRNEHSHGLYSEFDWSV